MDQLKSCSYQVFWRGDCGFYLPRKSEGKCGRKISLVNLTPNRKEGGVKIITPWIGLTVRNGLKSHNVFLSPGLWVYCWNCQSCNRMRPVLNICFKDIYNRLCELNCSPDKYVSGWCAWISSQNKKGNENLNIKLWRETEKPQSAMN